MNADKQETTYISFNQDQSYFAIGTQKGFKIFKLSLEITQQLNRDLGAGIGIVEMVHKTNIFALVGGGKTPKYPTNKLMIWDDSLCKCIVEISCKSDVKSVKIKTDRCIVVLETKIFIFNLTDFRVLDSIETCPNPKGLCSISSMREDLLLAYPSKRIGLLDVLYEREATKKTIEAHKSTICALEMCPNGHKLASASEKGTIIRIFDLHKGECIQQLRRGSEYAIIYSIAYDIKSRWLACSSDSGTVHIFNLEQTNHQLENQKDKDGFTKNKKSKFAIFSKLSSYFDSEWSFSLFRTQEKRTKVGFIGNQNSLAIVSTSGIVNLVKFDAQKCEECVKLAEYNISSNTA